LDSKTHKKYFILQNAIGIVVYDKISRQILHREEIDIRHLLPFVTVNRRLKVIIVDKLHSDILERFLGLPSEEKELAADQFFNKFALIKRDISGRSTKGKWFVPAHRWSFTYSPDFSHVLVGDSSFQGGSIGEYQLNGNRWESGGGYFIPYIY
jgi:hypothetical protein